MTTSDPDTGCPAADKKIGGESRCEECPFPDCIHKEYESCPSERREVYKVKRVWKTWLKEGSISAVSRKLKMTRDTVRRYLNDMEIYGECLADDPEYRALRNKYIVMKVAEGGSARDLAEMFSLTRQQVYRILNASAPQKHS